MKFNHSYSKTTTTTVVDTELPTEWKSLLQQQIILPNKYDCTIDPTFLAINISWIGNINYKLKSD